MCLNHCSDCVIGIVKLCNKKEDAENPALKRRSFVLFRINPKWRFTIRHSGLADFGSATARPSP